MKLNICYIVADKTDEWFSFSVQSVLPVADRFVFVIDTPDAYTWSVIDKAQEVKPVILIHRKYLHESKNADGLQRTAYLDWLKKNAIGEWAFVLDTDEVVSDNIREVLPSLNEVSCYDVRMMHVWWALGIEDATFDKHYVPRRLFKIKEGLSYPLVEHPLLQGHEGIKSLDVITIFHFSVVRGLLEEVKKYKTQCVKSNIHSPEQLKLWHVWHVLGTNPLRRFDIKLLPQMIKDFCCIDTEGNPVVYKEVV